MAVFPQDGHHPCLLVRGQLGKHVGALCCPGKFCIGHMIQIRTQQHIAHLQPHLLADGAGDLVVVAGEDLGGHTVVFQCPDGIGGGLLGRVEEGKIAQQHHVPLVLYAKGVHRGGVAFLGNGQHPEALVVQLVHGMQNFAAEGIC